MFPLTLKFSKEIEAINTIDSEIIIDKLKEELIRLKAEIIDSDKLSIHFKYSHYYSGRNFYHLMAAVDKGHFKIDIPSNKLIYSISILKLLISSIFISVFFSLIFQNINIGLYYFTFFYGIYLISTLIRHFIFLNRLKKMFNLIVIS